MSLHEITSLRPHFLSSLIITEAKINIYHIGELRREVVLKNALAESCNPP